MNLPIGPQSPKFIQLWHWIFNPMGYMETCAKKYGDIFTVRFVGYRRLVFVSHPEALQQILTSDTKELDAPGELNIVFESLLGKYSVISISGAEHQRQRQLLLPPFHGERMRGYSQVINDASEQVINQYQIGTPFNIRSVTQAITLQVIMQAVFGLGEGGARTQKLQQMLSQLLEKNSSVLRVVALYFPVLQRDFGPIKIWGEQMQFQQQVDQLIYAEIQERREDPDPSRTDILSLLMAARDEAGQPMTDVELRDELMTLLIAGHETTATALAWAFYWTHKLPTVREKLLQELDAVGDNPDPSTIFKLPYLNAVCSETLRIYPVGMLTFPRRVVTPLSVGGYELEPGTIVMGSIYLAHHREDIYPQSHLFRPERFLERQFSPYEYLPFGGGARRCIGLAFAQLEMKLALAKILSIRELELVDTRDVRAKRRGLVTGPERPIQMVIKGKRQAKSGMLETSTVAAY